MTAAKKTAAKKAAPKKTVPKEPAKAPAKIGRPPGYTYTDAIGDAICEHLALGKSLTTWCAIEGNHSYSTVCRWRSEIEGFSEKYARAREDQADFLAEEIIQISDDGANDTYKSPDGEVRVDADVVARSRLRVEARKWYAGKLKPKMYGDKVQVGGAEDLPPLQHLHTMSTEALLAIAGSAKT